MENSNDIIGNRACDLPTCSAVPQPTALPRCVCVCVYVCVGMYEFLLHDKICLSNMHIGRFTEIYCTYITTVYNFEIPFFRVRVHIFC